VQPIDAWDATGGAGCIAVAPDALDAPVLVCNMFKISMNPTLQASMVVSPDLH
jgi:hypothetical protein